MRKASSIVTTLVSISFPRYYVIHGGVGDAGVVGSARHRYRRCGVE
jgi:hypothetical protein